MYILNKQSWTPGKRWALQLGEGRKQLPIKGRQHVTKCYTGLLDRCTLLRIGAIGGLF
jgi:hypothetical protein